MTRRRTTGPDIARLRMLAADGVSMAEAARVMGSTPGAVQYRDAVWHIGFVRARRCTTGRELARLRTLAVDGVSMAEAARMTGMPARNVQYWDAVGRIGFVRVSGRPTVEPLPLPLAEAAAWRVRDLMRQVAAA